MVNLIIALILLITGINMPYLRYSVDLALDGEAPQYLIDKLNKTLYELREYGVVINEGDDDEEQTTVTKSHICNHDIGLPCAESEDVTMPETTLGYKIAGSDAPELIRLQADEVVSCNAQTAINSALATYGSVSLTGGTVVTNGSIVMDTPGQSLNLASGVTISFDTSGTIYPIITMDANYLSIRSNGMAMVRYSSQPPVGSGGYAIQVLGMCGHCTLENIRTYKTNYGFRCDTGDALDAALWNSVITNVDNRYFNEAGWWQHNSTSSGNIFNNLYLNNSEQDEITNNFSPVLLSYSGGTTVVFNQLNLEWTDNIECTPMHIGNVDHAVINGMHWEGLTIEDYKCLSFYGRFYGSLSINGWAIETTKIQGTDGGNIGFSSFIHSGNANDMMGGIIINGLNIKPDCDFSKVNNLYLVNDGGNTPTMIWCRACPDSSMFEDIVRVTDSGTGESGLKEYN